MNKNEIIFNKNEIVFNKNRKQYFTTKNIFFFIIKMIDIGYISVLFFICSFYSSTILDKLFYHLYGSSQYKKTYFNLLFQISSQIAVLSIFAYLIHKLVLMIPFPFNHIYNYEEKNLNSFIKGAFIYTFLILFSHHLRNKINDLREYLSFHIDKKIGKPETDVIEDEIQYH